MRVNSRNVSEIELTTGDNIIGAIIFFVYIIAALGFTFVIVKDIISFRTKQSKTTEKYGRSTSKISDASLAMLCSIAAFISFSVLSWNMLSFLLVSYAHWTVEHGIEISSLYTMLSSLRQQAWHVWIWATSSMLFETFAKDLLRDLKTWRWIQLSLLYHYACNVYISTIGFQYQTPHLWVYFVLNQILPVSFTQNLFLTATTLLTRSYRAVRKPLSANRMLRVIAVISYIGLLDFIPSTLQSPMFIPAVLLTRVNLFAPFLIDLVSYAHVGTSMAENRVRGCNFCCLVILAVFGVSSVMGVLEQISRPVDSTVANYAAAALLDDLLIGLPSSLLYRILS